MRVLHAIATLLLALFGAIPVSSHAQQLDETTMAMLGYVSGMASTHYCTCQRWPSTWAELKHFDDNLHAHSQSLGQEPVKRIPWSTLSDSRTAIAPEGNLSISVRRTGAEPIDISIPLSDCSDFNPVGLANLCADPRQ